MSRAPLSEAQKEKMQGKTEDLKERTFGANDRVNNLEEKEKGE
jgi:hypothetical protein